MPGRARGVVIGGARELRMVESPRGASEGTRQIVTLLMSFVLEPLHLQHRTAATAYSE
jgi:hypothetical protein